MSLPPAIINMYGPHFLVLYGITIAITLVGLHRYLRWCSPSPETAIPPVPEKPDPYEVAYLLGGDYELARLAVFDLIQRGYLECQGDASGPIAKIKGFFATDKIRQCEDHPSITYLSPMERTVFDVFASPRGRRCLSTALPNALEADVESHRKRLEEQELLASSEYRASARFAAFVAAGIILGLGGVKLVAALSKGHSNVALLILMAVVSVFCIWWISRVERVTSLGKQYIESLEDAFTSLRDMEDRNDALVGNQPAMLLAVGLFGVGVLAGTSYEFFDTIFGRGGSAGAGWAGGWGAGRYSDGCGGGGCGGGCGGGGCGGCGGG